MSLSLSSSRLFLFFWHRLPAMQSTEGEAHGQGAQRNWNGAFEPAAEAENVRAAAASPLVPDCGWGLPARELGNISGRAAGNRAVEGG